MNLESLYQSLYDKYGPQGWWPLLKFKGANPTLRGRCTGYHLKNYSLPDSESEILEVMLGTILTQNTSWINAEKALYELATNNLIDLQKLKTISTELLVPLIRSSGYYNQKTIKIKNLVQFLIENPINSLLSQPIDAIRPKLLEIKGVGPETCDSILLYALRKPVFVIDAYTRRLFIRLNFINSNADSYNQIQEFVQKTIQPSVEQYNEFHALIVQHVVQICKKTPQCDRCFITLKCNKESIIKTIQKKKSKKNKEYSS